MSFHEPLPSRYHSIRDRVYEVCSRSGGSPCEHDEAGWLYRQAAIVGILGLANVTLAKLKLRVPLPSLELLKVKFMREEHTSTSPKVMKIGHARMGTWKGRHNYPTHILSSHRPLPSCYHATRNGVYEVCSRSGGIPYSCEHDEAGWLYRQTALAGVLGLTSVTLSKAQTSRNYSRPSNCIESGYQERNKIIQR